MCSSTTPSLTGEVEAAFVDDARQALARTTRSAVLKPDVRSRAPLFIPRDP
jgi:hypothetical protein